MKKIGILIIFFITFLIIYFLQANFFINCKIAGVMPNLFIVLILYIGLFAGTSYAVSFGVITGIILDLLYGKVIGITAIMFCIVGYLAAYFDKNFSKESKLKIVIMVAGATSIYELGYYFLSSIIIGFDFETLGLIKILTLEIIYNVLITIIIYPFLQKTGYEVDRTFKKNNILTRYF